VSRDDGQSIVEFALTLPLIVLLMLGVLLVAEIGVARLTLEHAAAEAARTGALTNDDGLVRGTAAAALSPLDPAKVSVEIVPKQNDPPRSSEPRGVLLRVRLHYPVPVPLGFVGLPRVIVGGEAARRIEWSP
jgi:hypothetical protein